MKQLFYCICMISCVLASCQNQQDTSKDKPTNVKHYNKGYRFDKNGWTYVHIEGSPYERGFQHGFLAADIYKKYLECTKYFIFQTEGVEYNYFVENAVRLQKDKIPKELLEEMQGIADGLTKANVLTTLDDIIGWNAFLEISGSWWDTAKDGYVKALAKQSNDKKEHCSAFIATGSATKDGKIVIGHTSFDHFWSGQVVNFFLDVLPEQGQPFIMQSTPGYIYSGTDVFINKKGIVGVETTIAGFVSYDPDRVPYFVRTRLGIQYADTIDKFVKLLNEGNNGGMAATWLVGDINTNEIAKFEQGLYYQNFQKKKNGYWYGCNVVEDPQIRNLECREVGYNDVRQNTGGRRVRWVEMLTENNGQIDAEIGEKMLSDHYDVYRKKTAPGTNTICCHSDVSAQKYMSSPLAGNPFPFMPKGCVDGIVTTAEMVKNMQLFARWGRACGIPFNVKDFMKKHPQWQWQEKYLYDRPSQPWILIEAKMELK